MSFTLLNGASVWDFVSSKDYFERYGVTIYLKPDSGESALIQGIMIGDINLDMSVEYSAGSAVADAVKDAGESLGNAVIGNKGMELAKTAMNVATELTGSSSVNVMESIKRFSGSTGLNTFQITIYALSSQSSFKKTIESAIKLVSPTKGADSEASTMLYSPLNWQPTMEITSPLDQINANNTALCKINPGHLFTHLIVKSISYKPSRISLPSSTTPLYVELSITLEPARIIEVDVVKNWFLYLDGASAQVSVPEYSG